MLPNSFSPNILHTYVPLVGQTKFTVTRAHHRGWITINCVHKCDAMMSALHLDGHSSTHTESPVTVQCADAHLAQTVRTLAR